MKIVLTGGPCGGKTGAKPVIKEYFENKGYICLFVPETATILINGGINAENCGQKEFQRALFSIQLANEKAFDRIEKIIKKSGKKVITFCDRGALDGKSYLNDADFNDIIADFGKTEGELLSTYNAVFHLETVAKGDYNLYTTDNNSARTETADEAILLDNRTKEVWSKHKYFRVIENCCSYDLKLKKLIAEIEHLLNGNK